MYCLCDAHSDVLLMQDMEDFLETNNSDRLLAQWAPPGSFTRQYQVVVSMQRGKWAVMNPLAASEGGGKMAINKAALQLSAPFLDRTACWFIINPKPTQVR